MSSSFTNYLYRGEKDLGAVLSIVRGRAPRRKLDYPNLADLQELLGTSKIQQVTRLWQSADGSPAGYALVNRGDGFCALVFEYLSQFAGSGIGQEMIAWGEQIFREQYEGEAPDLMTTTVEDNQERVDLLEAAGYKRDSDSVVYMECPLDQRIETPSLPEGFTIRGAWADEGSAWVALHRAAFGTENMTLEYRHSMTAQDHYDPALDLVAVAPDGSLAAYVFCYANKEENALSGRNIGYTDPVATHPNYRRQGLSRALLLTGLRLLQECGMETAHLSTSSENIAMQKTAETAGFRIVGHSWVYSKILEKHKNSSEPGAIDRT